MPSQFVKVQVSTNYLLETSPNAFPSGAGFFSLTSSQYFPPRIPLGWWVYSGSLADTSSQVFLEGVVVPGQGDVTETTGSLIHTGSTEFTGSVNVSNDLNVIGSASVAELEWDGSVQDLSLFSESVSSEFTDIEIDSGSFDNRVDILEAASAASGTLWTGSSDGTISRESDVLITGSLNVTETGSFGFLEVNGDTVITETLEVTETGSFGTVEATSSRFGKTENDLHEFTGSVDITGSLNVDGTSSVAELEWDGSVQNLSLFSESVSSEFTDIEIDSGSFDSRLVLEEVTSSDHEARIVLVEATSSEVEGEMDDIHLSGSAGLGLWTASNGEITRNSNTQITGNLDISGNITAQEFHTELVSSSIIFLSGSTKFGDTQDDQHSFTGSVEITGSLNVDGTASVAELEWDGSVQNLTLFSESVSSEFTDIEIDSGSFDTRIDSLESVGFFFQAIHTGSTDVNDISPVSLSWDVQDLLDSPFTHSTAVVSSSEIQVGISGWYDTSYSVLHETFGNTRTSIQSVIRLNGFTNIQKTQVVAYKRNTMTGAATTNVWSGLIQLSSSDFIELILSNAGGGTSHEVITIPSSSLITLQLVRQL